MKHISILLALLFALAACNADSSDETSGMPLPDHESTASDLAPAEPLEPRMEDGIQVVEIEAGELGFAPISLSLEADVPARLVFTRTTEQTCATEVKIPAFGIGPVDLLLDEAVVVEFTPTESGQFAFVCGMDMQEGRLVVQS